MEEMHQTEKEITFRGSTAWKYTRKSYGVLELRAYYMAKEDMKVIQCTRQTMHV